MPQLAVVWLPRCVEGRRSAGDWFKSTAVTALVGSEIW